VVNADAWDSGSEDAAYSVAAVAALEALADAYVALRKDDVTPAELLHEVGLEVRTVAERTGGVERR
jgi:hypothetical protein